MIVFALATAVARFRRANRRGRDDDDTDYGGGGGGPGPGAPRGPEGDPSWWPVFERQFAEYVADSRRSTTLG